MLKLYVTSFWTELKGGNPCLISQGIISARNCFPVYFNKTSGTLRNSSTKAVPRWISSTQATLPQWNGGTFSLLGYRWGRRKTKWREVGCRGKYVFPFFNIYNTFEIKVLYVITKMNLLFFLIRSISVVSKNTWQWLSESFSDQSTLFFEDTPDSNFKVQSTFVSTINTHFWDLTKYCHRSKDFRKTFYNPMS